MNLSPIFKPAMGKSTVLTAAQYSTVQAIKSKVERCAVVIRKDKLSLSLTVQSAGGVTLICCSSKNE